MYICLYNCCVKVISHLQLCCYTKYQHGCDYLWHSCLLPDIAFIVIKYKLKYVSSDINNPCKHPYNGPYHFICKLAS